MDGTATRRTAAGRTPAARTTTDNTPAGGTSPARPSLTVGRDRECDRIDVLVAAVEHRGGSLVLHGEPGVGKTALLEYASTVADARVLWLRGVESEAVLPFAALADLLLPLWEHSRDLPDAQRAALEVCLALTAGPSPNLYAACAGTLSLLAAAGETRPLVFLADDLQWVDPSSQQVLLFVARRLSTERVTMLMTVRPDASELCDRAGVPLMEVTGLPAAACAELLRRHDITVAPAVVNELVRWTAGNPLALLEIAASLEPAQRSGEQPNPAPPRLGPRLERAWRSRLAGLPPRTLQALVVLAASHSSSLAVLPDALAAAELSLADLGPAERTGLVTTSPVAVEFRHPLVRAAVLRHVPLSSRLDVYRLLADVSTGDLRAWYLAAAASGPDETVATSLAEVARQARRRGGFGESARAWRRAAELTPDRRSRAERLMQAATDAHLGGLLHDAATWSGEAATLTDDPVLRADIELVRGRVLTWIGHMPRAHDQLVAAAHAVRDVDPGRASALLAEATLPAVMNGQIRLALADAEQAAELARHLPTSPTPTSLLLGQTLLVAGRVSEGRAILDAAGALPPAAANLSDQQVLVFGGLCRAWLDDDAEAYRMLTAVVDAARRDGIPATLTQSLAARSELDRWAGRWVAAYADATEALAWAQELRLANSIGYSLACLARLDAARGDRELCEDRVSRIHRDVRPYGVGGLDTFTSSILGLAALSHGDHETAVTHLERTRSLADDAGLGNPQVIPFAADLAEAHIRLGARDRAEVVLDWLDERAQTTGLAWPAAAGARCRGLLAERADEAEACFEAAEAAHRRRTMPFEQARTLLCRGEVLRRLRRPAAARSPLLAAQATFDSLGAAPWARRAATELAAAGGRRVSSPRAPALPLLTPQELQVARAVADGMNNVEAAAALFVSRKTVEAHLTRAYRKLGVRSRTELTRTLVSHDLVGDDSDE